MKKIACEIQQDNLKYSTVIWNSIKQIGEAYDKNPDKFSDLESIKKTLCTILCDNGMSQDCDDRIKNVVFDDVTIFGFEYGSSGTEVYKFEELCYFLSELNQKINDTYNLSISSCVFNWDSSCCFVIAIYKNKNKEDYNNVQFVNNTLKKYIFKTLHPNGNKIYGYFNESFDCYNK